MCQDVSDFRKNMFMINVTINNLFMLYIKMFVIHIKYYYLPAISLAIKDMNTNWRVVSVYIWE